MSTLRLHFCIDSAHRGLETTGNASLHPGRVLHPEDPATWTSLLRGHSAAALQLPSTLSPQDLRCARAFAFAAFTSGVARFEIDLVAPLAKCDARVLEALAFVRVLDMPKSWRIASHHARLAEGIGMGGVGQDARVREAFKKGEEVGALGL